MISIFKKHKIKTHIKNSKQCPRVGLGVIIINAEGKILIGKREGSYALFYSIPGGHLEMGETFENGAIREIKEETDLQIEDPKVMAITNNLKTYRNEGVHYISIILITKKYSGILKNKEPKKCEGWIWVDPKKLPKPHFDASEQAVTCYLKKIFY